MMPRANYIHTLQDRVAELELELERQAAKERELVTYLNLPKFTNGDPTVQVTDILHRLGRF
jgi:hypothetical protein